MSYKIHIVPRAQRQIKELPDKIRKRVINRIDGLKQNPRPRSAQKLKGKHDLYRLRVGDYRIIYGIREDQLLVIVISTGHRREIYKQLKNKYPLEYIQSLREEDS